MASLSSFAAKLMADIESGATEREEWFDEQTVTLFELQFEQNAAYRKHCESLRVRPESIGSCLQIPSIPTSAFKEFDFTSIQPGECTTVFHSSGTTEQRPSRHFHNRESLGVYERTLLLPFKNYFLPDRERIRLLSLTPPKAAARNSSLVHMFETVVREFGDSGSGFAGVLDSTGAWAVDAEKAVGTMTDISEPIGVLGTAFSFVFVVDELERRKLKLKLPPGSRVLETGGYKGRSRMLEKRELHSLIARSLGIDANAVISEYGMCELSSQAYDRMYGQSGQRVFRFPGWARAAVVSPENGRAVGEGEAGLIRVIDLANVWSVLAIQTEDIGIRRGSGFELLGRSTRTEARGCSLMSVQAK